MPQENCQTGREIFATKAAAVKAFSGTATRCDRCRGWHADNDRPKTRAARRERRNVRR